jgi:hypothetical protein
MVAVTSSDMKTWWRGVVMTKDSKATPDCNPPQGGFCGMALS